METKTRTYERYVPRAQTNTTVKEKQNLPLKKFKAGSVAATIWENQNKNDEGQLISFKNVSFERHYKDASGQWQTTSTLRANDLPKAMLILSKAYEYHAIEGAAEE